MPQPKSGWACCFLGNKRLSVIYPYSLLQHRHQGRWIAIAQASLSGQWKKLQLRHGLAFDESLKDLVEGKSAPEAANKHIKDSW